MAIVWTAFLLLFNISPAFSLKCLQCVGTAASCPMLVKTCPSYETSCFALAYKGVQGSSTVDTVIKGCSTPQICNQTSIIDAGVQSVTMSSSCCEKNFCNINRFNTLPVFSNRLECSTCADPTKPCKSADTSIFCDEVNSYCVDVVTSNYTNGKISGTMYSKGCGSGEGCNTLFSYNTGSFQHYTQFSCCNSNNKCNNIQKSVTVLTNDNGIKCWGCQETGKGECATQNQTLVSCTGLQIRCMEAFDERNQTWFKGCSTVSFCSSTYPYLNTLPSISGIECCAGSLCNNFSRIYDTTNTTVSHAHRTNTDFRLLIFLASFLFATFGHFH
ncbi:urokinase plasminogen activator surface receptor-like [Pelobates fuscus]|uniref:urokinase plasminogen activator surface receptor-like n=1 Tax=Pelobates fuscus TaxID=191477 RepID=UPI002FE4D5AB